MESSEEIAGDQVEEGNIIDDEHVIGAAYEDGDEVLCEICDPEDEEVEEAQAHRTLRNPYAPYKKDREDHRILH